MSASDDVLSLSTFDDEVFLTTAEVAQILRVSRATAYELTSGGKIRSLRVGNRIRVQVKHLREYIDANSIPRPSPLADLRLHSAMSRKRGGARS